MLRLRPTHVLQCSCSGLLLLQAEWVEALSAAEVHNFYDVKVGHYDVVWLEVQVEDTSVM